MNKHNGVSSASAIDLLGEYIAGVNELPEKLARIAANCQSSEQSLGRAAAALRSIGALSRHRHDPDLGNCRSSLENAAGAQC